ncbi:cupin domain-containing protein [Microbacterium sp. NPDC076911]|uniref:helix-turn-helix domain-containing protein n=1 Tax=Microbacterium sp. NPDC076911 TaxID=3154958 RepID=UPI003431DA31
MPESAKPTNLPEPTDPAELAQALGSRIRALRKSRGMTLMQAATEAGLSHSFLSQVERGLERLSMSSLYRVARTLGTTQQALLTAEPDERPRGDFHVFRGEAASPVDAGSGAVTVLAQQRARFLPMIFAGEFPEDGLWWQHDEEEFVYILEGELIVTIDDKVATLEAGDATYFESGVRHKWRTSPGKPCRALVVKEQQHDGAAASS